jgi:hypothetical protein
MDRSVASLTMTSEEFSVEQQITATIAGTAQKGHGFSVPGLPRHVRVRVPRTVVDDRAEWDRRWPNKRR